MAATRTAAECSAWAERGSLFHFLLHFSGAHSEVVWVRTVWSKDRERKFQQSFTALWASPGSTAVSLPQATVGNHGNLWQASWDKKDYFHVKLHHFQLPEIIHHCCCMSASAGQRQKMGRAGNESEGRTAFKALKLHPQYFYWIPSQIQIIQIGSKGVF